MTFYSAVDNGLLFTLIEDNLSNEVDVLRNVESVEFDDVTCTIDENACLDEDDGIPSSSFSSRLLNTLETVECPDLGANPFSFRSDSVVCYYTTSIPGCLSSNCVILFN